MNLFNIFSDIEKIDPEAEARFAFTRRKMLKTTSIAAAASPIFVASVINKAYADNGDIVSVLNFALLLEYLEADFYEKGLMSGLPFGNKRALFEEIGKHEKEHVDFLKASIAWVGGQAIGKPEFDFTAGGMFPNPFSNFDVFLTLSQAFEDLGVRAYKGQAPKLFSHRDVLLGALRIHSTEARHAAEIRLVRGLRVWASEQETGGAPAAVYKGENNIHHHDAVDLISLTYNKLLEMAGGDQTPAERIVRESFDEPLTREEVLAIAGPFVRTAMP
ncbi:ferritin-like domain-containing protein [Larkinella arboricola]|uniref:Ferritin-like protein n=1 Tax=Larkinella arboricola TaxID=643671 RepID=A0A327X1C3_LARAB|nr:ferritin-like domain-containing protein [Larkinella arboricola]RAK00281.1 ferritin-like protein [Larkinella arboricola]